MARSHKYSTLKKAETSSSFVSPREKNLALQFLNRLSPLMPTSTNPSIMKGILQNLNLISLQTRDKNFNEFLAEITSEKPKGALSTIALFDKIKKDVLENPTTCKLLAVIQDKALISDQELVKYKETMELQLNWLYLLEAFTIGMANSKTLSEDIYKYCISLRSVTNPGNPYENLLFGIKKAGLFLGLKLISVEAPMLSLLLHKRTGTRDEKPEDVTEFINDLKLSGFNATADVEQLGVRNLNHVSGWALNILEAVWQDSMGKTKDSGGKTNADAGCGLVGLMEAKNYDTRFDIRTHFLPENVKLTKNDTYPLIPSLKIDGSGKKAALFNIDKEWRDLYNSWNLRFCIANVDPVITPIKLLIPSIFAAVPENFQQARTLSLYLVANLMINANPTENPFFQTKATFQFGQKILDEWGNINSQYASHILKKLAPNVKETPPELYFKVNGNHPNLNLLRNFVEFFRKNLEFRSMFDLKSNEQTKTNLRTEENLSTNNATHAENGVQSPNAQNKHGFFTKAMVSGACMSVIAGSLYALS